MKNRIVLIIALLFMSLVQASAQVLLGNFPQTNGTINAVKRTANKLFLGGDFTYVGKATGSLGAYSLENTDSVTIPIEIHGKVSSIVTDAAGKTYIGGDFTLAGQKHYLVALNPDFSRDMQFACSPSGPVNNMLVIGNKLLIAGTFNAVNDQTRIGLAEWQLSTNSLSSFAPNPDGIIHALAFDGSRIWVGGSFSFIAGGLRSSLAALQMDGTLATANFPINGLVNSLYFADSILFIGGAFDSVSGVYRSNIASVNPQTSELRLWAPQFDGAVLTLDGSNGLLYTGGSFNAVNGTNSRANLAAVNQLTGVLSNFDPGTDGPVRKLKVQNGLIHFSGDFNSVGMDARAGFAITSSSGSVQPSTLVNGKVNDFSASGNLMIFGGQFSSFGGKQQRYFAALDYKTGELLNWNLQADGPIHSMEINSGNIVLAGAFSSINQNLRYGLAMVDTTDGTLQNWDPGCNGQVYATAILGNSIYVGGNFSGFGDSTRLNIASLSLINGNLNPWAPAVDAEVRKMQVQGPDLYISGEFTQVNSLPRRSFAAFSLSSNGDLKSINLQLDSSVNDFILLPNSALLTGPFSMSGAQSVSGLISADLTTGNVTSLSYQYSGTPSALLYDNNTLFLGGQISSQAKNGLLTFAFPSGNSLEFPVSITSGAVRKMFKVDDRLILSGNFEINTTQSFKENLAIVDLLTQTPTQQSAAIQLRSLTAVSAKVAIIPGNGAKRLLLIKQNSVVDTIPSDGQVYSSSSSFGAGQPIASSFVALAGSDTLVEITGLNFNTTYHLASFEYNGFGSYTTYLASNPARISFTTPESFQPPTVQATALTASEITLNSAKLKWTSGNGSERIVIGRAASNSQVVPSDSTTYFASSTFGNGSELGTGNFVVYKGSGDSCFVSDLLQNTTYNFEVYEYNGFNLLTRLNKVNPASTSFTTLQLGALPATPATGLTVVSTSTNEIQLSWTNGSGSSRIVIASENDSVRTMPQTGIVYETDNFFNGNSSYLSQYERVVYVGSGNSVTVKGLSQLTSYAFAVIEYNGAQLTANYLTSTFPQVVAVTKTSIQAPTQASTNLSLVSSGVDSLRFAWTPGNGEKRLVVLKKDAAVTGIPMDGKAYFPEIGDTLSDGSLVVASGNVNEILLNGLVSDQVYHLAVFEFNDSEGLPVYLTSTFASGSGKTLTTVGLKKLLKSGFKVYPNPVKEGKVFISLPDAERDGVKIVLYTTSGTEIKAWSKSETKQIISGNSVPLQVGDLPAGNYLMKIEGRSSSFSQTLSIQ
ncbi:hypothetical protein MASR2M44_05000 [Bacteroidota bacterium]